MSTPLVHIQALVKQFGEQPPALRGIDASFSAGKILGLVGPDGAGKTTLIRLMAGLLKPTSGKVTLLGRDSMKDAEEIHAMIGYMPQKFGLYEDLTVQENLQLYADLQNVTGAEKRERFETLLHFTALEPFTGRLAGKLSGGMKQKLGLACTLLRKPTLLLLDEPSVGVDPISRRELWKMVSSLVSDDIAVIWSTAYLDEAERCTEVLLLNEGKLLYQGSPLSLTEKLIGRTFQIQNITTDRRHVLTSALCDKRVSDGGIQGESVRIILRKDVSGLEAAAFGAGESATLAAVPPRFEDAFIDMLGGGPGGESTLAKKLEPHPSDGKMMVEAKGLTKQFDSFTAAKDITFSVRRGEIFGLLGPNGAGKSTTFKMLCGLLTPTSGQAIVAGISLQHAVSEARGRIGYMAQKFSLYGNMTVKQNLRFFSGIYPVPKRDEAVDEMIETFSLAPYVNASAGELPLGFKQRLALACAVMHRPEVIFLDEPTSGVDPITRREFWNHINGMVGKGVTIIITTHFMDEAEYCDRIGLINHGTLLTIDSPDALKAKVATEELPEPTLEDAFVALSTTKEGAHD